MLKQPHDTLLELVERRHQLKMFERDAKARGEELKNSLRNELEKNERFIVEFLEQNLNKLPRLSLDAISEPERVALQGVKYGFNVFRPVLSVKQEHNTNQTEATTTTRVTQRHGSLKATTV